MKSALALCGGDQINRIFFGLVLSAVSYTFIELGSLWTLSHELLVKSRRVCIYDAALLWHKSTACLRDSRVVACLLWTVSDSNHERETDEADISGETAHLFLCLVLQLKPFVTVGKHAMH